MDTHIKDPKKNIFVMNLVFVQLVNILNINFVQVSEFSAFVHWRCVVVGAVAAAICVLLSSSLHHLILKSSPHEDQHSTDDSADEEVSHGVTDSDMSYLNDATTKRVDNSNDNFDSEGPYPDGIASVYGDAMDNSHGLLQTSDEDDFEGYENGNNAVRQDIQDSGVHEPGKSKVKSSDWSQYVLRKYCEYRIQAS